MGRPVVVVTPACRRAGRAPVELEGPLWVVQGTDVTHLRYRVRR
jgi:hypothetical protein